MTQTYRPIEKFLDEEKRCDAAYNQMVADSLKDNLPDDMICIILKDAAKSKMMDTLRHECSEIDTLDDDDIEQIYKLYEELWHTNEAYEVIYAVYEIIQLQKESMNYVCDQNSENEENIPEDIPEDENIPEDEELKAAFEQSRR